VFAIKGQGGGGLGGFFTTVNSFYTSVWTICFEDVGGMQFPKEMLVIMCDYFVTPILCFILTIH